MTRLYQFLFLPGEYQAPRICFQEPAMILQGNADCLSFGSNGIFHRPGDNRVESVLIPTARIFPSGESSVSEISVDAPFSFDFLYFSEEQRKVAALSAQRLANITGTVTGMGQSPDAHASDLTPFVFAVETDNRLTLYHFTDLAHHGGLSLSYHQEPFDGSADVPARWKALVGALAAGFSKLTTARELLNDNCWYTQWRSGYEMERKYTFKNELPDTWRLINRLYREILDGALPGFVPELDMAFQVFDYESHIFQVTAPEEQQGYISFIPQTDGKMTIKQKWFKENAELRKETVTWNNTVPLGEIEIHALEMTGGGELLRLPVFRRKRFDVNFESITTGNIYGVYLDICRIPESGCDDVFGQCEVEYCRSRTLWEIRNVMEEFELACEFTQNFLIREGVSFEHNLFSKLDFVRQVHDAKLNPSVVVS